jgi:hypothetical protein
VASFSSGSFSGAVGGFSTDGAPPPVVVNQTLGGGSLGADGRRGYINRFPPRRRAVGPETGLAEPLGVAPESLPEPELSPREKKRLRKQLERSLLADGAQRRGFEQLAGLIGTLQRSDAQAMADLAALQAMNDEEELLLLMMS